MTSFLDYYKIILDKVSFDPALLKKEYQKAKRNLCTNEIQDLNSWLRSRGFQIVANEQFYSAAEPKSFQKNIFHEYQN